MAGEGTIDRIEIEIEASAKSAESKIVSLAHNLNTLKSALGNVSGKSVGTLVKKLEDLKVSIGNLDDVVVKVKNAALAMKGLESFGNVRINKNLGTQIRDLAISCMAFDDHTVGNLMETAIALDKIAAARKGLGGIKIETATGDITSMTAIDSDTEETIRETGEAADDASEKIAKLENEVARLNKQAESTKVGGLASKLGAVASAFKRIVFYRMIRSIIKEITQAVRVGVDNLYQWSKAMGGDFANSMDRGASSLLYFKNSIGAALAPLINALVPILEKVVAKVVDLLNSMNQVFALLTGASYWTRATYEATEYGDAVNSAAGSMKKLHDYTLAFDELNVFDDSSSGGGGGGSSNIPDYSNMFENVGDFDYFTSSLMSLETPVGKATLWLEALGDRILRLIGIDRFDIADKISLHWDEIENSNIFKGLETVGELFWAALGLEPGKVGEYLQGEFDNLDFDFDSGILGGMNWLGKMFWEAIGVEPGDVGDAIFGLFGMNPPGNEDQYPIPDISGAMFAVNMKPLPKQMMDFVIVPIAAMVTDLFGDGGTLDTEYAQNAKAFKKWFGKGGSVSETLGQLAAEYNDTFGNGGSIESSTNNTKTLFSGLFGAGGKLEKYMRESISSTKTTFSPLAKWFETDVTEKIKAKFSSIFGDNGTVPTVTRKAVEKIMEPFIPLANWFGINVTEKLDEKFGGVFGDGDNSVEQKTNGFISNFKESFSSLVGWTEDNVTEPTKNAFQSMFDDIEDSVTGNSATSSLSNTMTDAFSGVISSFQRSISSAMNSPFEAINDLINWLKKIRIGSSYPFANMNNIIKPGGWTMSTYASGGFPSSGEIYIARENGISEMVGRIGNRNAVANNQQIEEGIARATERANESTIRALYAVTQTLVRAIEDNATDFIIGDEQIGRANQRYQNSKGTNGSRGAFAYAL